jgi:hypothetical protein
VTRRRLFGAAALLASLCCGRDALAFCRTTTCDPNDPTANCPVDANKCVTTGLPLAWRSSCVTVGVQQMGSPRNGLGYETVERVVQQAFDAWLHADCGQGGPSIDVQLLGPVECGLSEYNADAGNANIVLFREDEWPYVGAAYAIGLTTTRFDTETGDMWDADIELNGVGPALSVGDPITGDDLLSVLTHEAGHFLGLSHSSDPTATMKAIYNAASDGTSFRSLADDDVAGICGIYPPGRRPATTSCENRHGFSAQCGADQPAPDTAKACSLNSGAPGSGSAASSLASVAILAAVCGGRLARRRRIV